jgi:uncharacterized membrane protein YkvA (DUF1232 family)
MSAPESSSNFSGRYSEENLWQKTHPFALTAGKEVMEKVLTLYHAAMDRDTPAWARTVILSTLGYFILPLDAIPDMVPGLGYRG